MSRARTLEHIADVRRRPGLQRHLTRTFAVGDLGTIATSSATVIPDGEVHFDGEVEAAGLDVILTGAVTAPWEGECRRCLDDVVGSVTAELREVFSPVVVEGETWPVDGDSIDLGPVLHDTILLSLPLVPLCSEDCVGPAPDRFPALVAGDPALADEAGDDDAPPAPAGDPRWAALDALRFDQP